MSDHSKALVPLESWCYNSPEISYRGGVLDFGLLAEALIYYDQVLINVLNQPQFAEFLRWFINRGKYSDLLALFNDKTIQVYDYAFISTAVEFDGTYNVLNIQDPIQEKPNTFEQRFLYHESVQNCFKHARDRIKLYKVLRNKVTEAKASEFGNTIENARKDYLEPQRSSLLIQSFIDEIYPLLNWGNPPEVIAKIEPLDEAKSKHRITWNIDIKKISEALGGNLPLHIGTPLTAAVHCNRFLWSAANLNCDLYLGRPMSTLVGDKLYESGYRIIKSRDIIDQLIVEVEFPDIRTLVNTGKINLDDILSFRKKAVKFRRWLQEERTHDRNAIIAYHNELAKETGWTKVGRKTLRLFGFLGAVGGPFTGGLLGGNIAGIPGPVLGSIAGKGVEYLLDLASKLNANWRPVIFGNWIRDRIEKTLERTDYIK